MRDDQARGLRRLFARRAPRPLGVGGTDATGVVVELALAMAELGTRVLVVDRTRGEVPSQLGLRARYELAHVLAGDLALEAALLAGPPGVTVLPAARGLDELALGSRAEDGGWQGQLAARLAAAGREADVWLVNGLPPTGSDADVLLALRPTARGMTGTYAHVKALATLRGQRTFGVIVDRAASDAAAHAAFTGLADVARRHLAADLRYRGHVPAGAAPQRRTAFLHLAHALLPAPASP